MKSPRPRALSDIAEVNPALAQTIGELTVEFNSLDAACGLLFGYVLRLNFAVAHILFHTPKAYYQRVEMLENAIIAAFKDKSAPRKKCTGLAGRYRKIVDKRHKLNGLPDWRSKSARHPLDFDRGQDLEGQDDSDQSWPRER